MKPLTAVVIGCGSIGALKPDQYDRPDGGRVLTHAHAYYNNSDVDLVAVVDQDSTRAWKAGTKWNTEGYYSLADNPGFAGILTHLRPDIISVCTPTETHFDVLKRIATIDGYKPRLVVAEKPFCLNIGEAADISDLYKRMKIPILVNYSRRFSTHFQTLKILIERGDLGEIYHARLLYGRGLLRDGCHGLDLFNYLFGEPLTGPIVLDTPMFDGINNDDPTYSLRLQYKKCRQVYMIGVDSRKYGIFELEIVAENGIYRYAENGLVAGIRNPTSEPVYGNYKSMPAKEVNYFETDLHQMLPNMVENVVRHLTPGFDQPLLSTHKNAMRVHWAIKWINRNFDKRRKLK